MTTTSTTRFDGARGVITATLAAGVLFVTGAAVGAAIDHEGVDMPGGGGVPVTSLAAPAAAAAAGPVQAAAPPAGAVTPRTERPAEARALSQAFKAAAKAVRPSVVRVDVKMDKPRVSRVGDPKRRLRILPEDGEVPEELRRFFHFGPGMPDLGDLGEGLPRKGTGSGFIISAAGDIVTNRHVVQGAGKVVVTLQDGRELSARVIGKDEQTDVAVIRLDSPPKDLVAARLGDSDKLEVGEWVLAIGSPLGQEQTVTVGIVSSKGKASRARGMFGSRVRNYIQTDAKINPGNSGGPLLTLDGEVVGINTFINVGPGGAYGFAIPINESRRVADTLIKDGRVRYAFLGVRVGDVKGAAPEQIEKLGKDVPRAGALVDQVTPGSPAAKLGLHPGDVITKLDGQRIDGADDVVSYVSSRPIGAKIGVGYWREGKTIAGSTVLGELPSEDDRRPEVAEQGVPSGKIGLALQTLTPELAQTLGVAASTRGAAIADVIAGSPAEKAGLRPGDVLVEVDHKPVASADEARKALQADKKTAHLLRVRNASGARFVAVKPAE